MTAYAKLAERYLILIEGGPPANYSAWSPDLPGCAGVGDTLDEVVDLVAAVTPPLLAELDVAELLGRQLHAADANAALVPIRGPSAAHHT